MTEYPKIFLSYAREDGYRVNALYDRLINAGFKPWMDTRDVLPGQEWRYYTKQALKQADLVIVCLSRISVAKRSFIQREIRDALDHLQEKLDSDVYLIPVRLEACEVPENLSHIQWFDVFADDGWDRLLTAIKAVLAQDNSTPPEIAQQSPDKTASEGGVAQPKEQEVAGHNVSTGSTGGHAVVVIGDGNEVLTSKRSRPTRNKAR